METRQKQVIEQIRSWVMHGTLSAGQKLSEKELAEALNVSRTPVRHALAVLVEEGLLTRIGARGYTVRSYYISDVIEAIDLRALIEGYAARQLALAGAPEQLIKELEHCLKDGDEIFAKGHFVEADEQPYAQMNKRFHELITGAGQSDLLQQVQAVIDRVPFGAPDAIAFDFMDEGEKFKILQYAHMQHHAIVDAICARDGARAEALFREHAAPVKKSLGIAHTHHNSADGQPGEQAQHQEARSLPFIDPQTPLAEIYDLNESRRNKKA